MLTRLVTGCVCLIGPLCYQKTSPTVNDRGTRGNDLDGAESNPRPPRHQRGALPLSYTQFLQSNPLAFPHASFIIYDVDDITVGVILADQASCPRDWGLSQDRAGRSLAVPVACGATSTCLGFQPPLMSLLHAAADYSGCCKWVSPTFPLHLMVGVPFPQRCIGELCHHGAVQASDFPLPEVLDSSSLSGSNAPEMCDTAL